jgi:hypothetical protein
MGQSAGVCYDPETVELLRSALEEAWDAIPEERRKTTDKSELAERILAAAMLGERDPDRLRMRALLRPSCGEIAGSGAAASILRAALSREA